MTTNFYLFWDKKRDELELLDEEGEFWFYSEDAVGIARGHDNARFWTRLEKLEDKTPLNAQRSMVF